MQYDDFFNRMTYPTGETVLRPLAGHDTLSFSRERPLPPPNWMPGQTIGRFTLHGVLGEGITSTVYDVSDGHGEGRYALKLLRIADPESLTTSRLGYRRLMPLTHPSLVRIYDIVQWEGMPAILMEQVVGVPVAELIPTLAEDAPAACCYAMHVARDVSSALQLMHTSGLVHRDIKPDNLLIQANGRVRLVDYGLVGTCDPVADPDARRGYLAGSFWYMAPESVYSQIYPPACDIYSLGIVLLELVADAGRLPKPQWGQSLMNLVGCVDDVVPQDTPAPLRDLIAAMLDAQPENRPTAAEVTRSAQQMICPKMAATVTVLQPPDSIARDSERQAVSDWFMQVARSGDRASWLDLSGPSGCGKSWLAVDVCKRMASYRWFQIFDASCSKLSDKSFAVFDDFIDVLARRFTRIDRSPLQLSAQTTEVLVQQFPALTPLIAAADWAGLAGDGPPPDSPPVSRDRSQLVSSLLELMRAVSHFGPILLMVDDFQWVDRDSARALEQLLAKADYPLGLLTVSATKPPLDIVAEPDQTVTLALYDLPQLTDLAQYLVAIGLVPTNQTCVHAIVQRTQGSCAELRQQIQDVWNQRMWPDSATDAVDRLHSERPTPCLNHAHDPVWDRLSFKLRQSIHGRMLR